MSTSGWAGAAPPRVLAPDGEPRFVWSVLPPGESSYNAAVSAQIVQRHAWRAQWRCFAKGPDAFRVGRHLRYDPDVVRLWLVEQCVREAS